MFCLKIPGFLATNTAEISANVLSEITALVAIITAGNSLMVSFKISAIQNVPMVAKISRLSEVVSNKCSLLLEERDLRGHATVNHSTSQQGNCRSYTCDIKHVITHIVEMSM